MPDWLWWAWLFVVFVVAPAGVLVTLLALSIEASVRSYARRHRGGGSARGRFLPWALLLTCGWQTHQQIGVWTSNATLWSHAAVHAPGKPRVRLNAAMADMIAGRLTDAEHGFRLTMALAEQPHVAAYDRADARAAAKANLETLTLVRAVLAP